MPNPTKNEILETNIEINKKNCRGVLFYDENKLKKILEIKY